ncbi:MAG TPA: hypothetical protein VLA17_10895 [Candidatus Limnocylindria bacterium]|nr:hypothetical protein [Candidatus Limnocylindria bacterium]
MISRDSLLLGLRNIQRIGDALNVGVGRGGIDAHEPDQRERERSLLNIL